jgi:predicted flap endonuclease-1-like 5' DNA nuclease
MRDPLQRISGIGAEVEKVLNARDVARYSQIAGWTDTDIERYERLLGFNGRIRRENWVEQAQILSKGGATAHSREWDRQRAEAAAPVAAPPATSPAASPAVPPPAPPPARPVDLARAIQENAVKPKDAAEAVAGPGPGAASPTAAKAAAASPVAAAAAAAAVAADPVAKRDLSSLGSVRSELLRPSAGPPLPRAGTPSDLKRIRGIGVLIEKKLNALGVTSYEQVAGWTQSDIDKVSAHLDFRGRIERESWVEQARILAAGGQTEFSRRVDKGDVETSKPRS